MQVVFEDNTLKVLAAMDSIENEWLELAAGEIESQAADITPYDTHNLQNSWRHVVDEGAKEATIGNPVDYSIYVEFGTGIYAVQGNGRKTPWFYEDKKGKGHFTRGSRPHRMLWKSYEFLKTPLQKLLETMLRGLE